MYLKIKMDNTKDAWKTQELKVWPEFYQHIVHGRKNFEIRKFDRPFAEGTTLILNEWDNVTESYTGEQCVRTVTYVLRGGQFGIEPGYCVLGLSAVQEAERICPDCKGTGKVKEAETPEGHELAKELYDIAALQLMENAYGNSREALKEIVELFESNSIAAKVLQSKAEKPAGGEVTKVQIIKAAKKNIENWNSSGAGESRAYKAFIRGAEWLQSQQLQTKNEFTERHQAIIRGRQTRYKGGDVYAVLQSVFPEADMLRIILMVRALNADPKESCIQNCPNVRDEQPKAPSAGVSKEEIRRHIVRFDQYRKDMENPDADCTNIETHLNDYLAILPSSGEPTKK